MGTFSAMCRSASRPAASTVKCTLRLHPQSTRRLQRFERVLQALGLGRSAVVTDNAALSTTSFSTVGVSEWRVFRLGQRRGAPLREMDAVAN